MSNCSMEHKSDTFAGSTLEVKLSNDPQSEMKNEMGIKFGDDCNGNEPDNVQLDDSENETKHENFYTQSQEDEKVALDFSIPPLLEKIHCESASSIDHEATLEKKKLNEDDVLKHDVQDEIDLQNLEPAQDKTEISDDMADACKTICKICHQAFPLTSMRYHTLKEHKVQITEYKQMYGNFEIIKMVYHKCHLCGKLVLLDSDRLGGHIKGTHKMKEKQYKAEFMVLASPKLQATQRRSKKVIKEEDDAEQNPSIEIVKTGVKRKREKGDCNGKSKSLKMPKETGPSPQLESKKKTKSKTSSKKIKATTVREEIFDVHKDKPTEEILDVNQDKPTEDLTNAEIVMDMDKHEDVTTDILNSRNVSKGITDTNEDVAKHITDNTEDVDKDIIDNIEEVTQDITIKNKEAATDNYSEWISDAEQNPSIEMVKTGVKRNREKGDCNGKSKSLKMPKETSPIPQLESKKKTKSKTSKKIKATTVREEILDVNKDKPTEDLTNADIVMDMDEHEDVTTDILIRSNVSNGITDTNEDVANTDNTEDVNQDIIDNIEEVTKDIKIKEAATDDYSEWVSDCENNGLYCNGGPRVLQGWKICFEERIIDGLEVMVAKYRSPTGHIYTRQQNGYQIPDLMC